MKKIVTVQQREFNLASGRHVITHQCAWCGCSMGVTIDSVVSGVSHGYCPPCDKQARDDYKNGVRRHPQNTMIVNPKFLEVQNVFTK